MNVRMVIALNMYDELEASGNTLDYVKLSQLFGVSMLPTVSRLSLIHILRKYRPVRTNSCNRRNGGSRSHPA